MAVSKPLVVARQDFVSDIVNLINSAGLPMFVVGDILKEVQAEVQVKAQEQYNMALDQYKKELKAEKEKKEAAE